MALKTVTGARSIDGALTSCSCAEFADYVTVSLTQFESLGTVIVGEKNAEGRFVLNVKMGNRDNEHVLVLARQITESIKTKKLVLTVAVAPRALGSLEAVRVLVDLVDANRTWT